MELAKSYTQTSVSTTAAGKSTVLQTATASQTARLHGLILSLSTTGTFSVMSGSSVGSTDATTIAGPIAVPGNTYFHLHFDARQEATIAGTASKNLYVTSTGATLAGYAWSSKE